MRNVYYIHWKKIKHFTNEYDNLNKYLKRYDILKKKLEEYQSCKMSPESLNKLEHLRIELIDYKDRIDDIKQRLNRNDYELVASSILPSYHNSSHSYKKNDLIEQKKRELIYLRYVEPNRIKQSDKIIIKQKAHKKCENCGKTKIIYVGNDQYQCANCSYLFRIVSHNDVKNCYNRKNHLDNSIDKIKKVKQVNIKEEDYKKIVWAIEPYKHRITPMEIKKILKSLKFSKYYKYVSYIYYDICNKNLPMVNAKELAQIKENFAKVSRCWESKVRPSSRSSFMSYPYVIRKIAELRGFKDWFIHFPYTGDENKLMNLDKYWREICRELNYKFISSICEK